MSIMKIDTYSFQQLIPHLSQTNIVFDLNGVLLAPNNRVFISEVGLPSILLYSIRHAKSLFNILKKLLSFMNAIQPPAKTQNEAKYFGKDFLPGPICDWQLGTKTNEQIMGIIESEIKQLSARGFFASKLEERVISKAAHALFTPSIMANKEFDLLPQGIELLNACARQMTVTGKHKHNLYLLTNFNTQTLDLIVKKFPDIFNVFNLIITSAEARSMKPEKQIFIHLLKKAALKLKTPFFSTIKKKISTQP